MAQVLIVDDSRMMRGIMRRALLANGIADEDIQDCGDGQEAMDVLRESDPPIDLVLLDWNMPSVDGMELLGSMRSDGLLDHTRVVMVTSMSEDSDEEHARSAGAVGYIVKPFTPDDLRESLSDWLSACPTGSSEQSEPQ